MEMLFIVFMLVVIVTGGFFQQQLDCSSPQHDVEALRLEVAAMRREMDVLAAWCKLTREVGSVPAAAAAAAAAAEPAKEPQPSTEQRTIKQILHLLHTLL